MPAPVLWLDAALHQSDLAASTVSGYSSSKTIGRAADQVVSLEMTPHAMSGPKASFASRQEQPKGFWIIAEVQMSCA